MALGAPERLARESAAGEVRFAAPPGLDTASLAARLGARTVREVEPGRYVVEAAPAPAQLAALAGWMNEQGALLTELSVARHSLEEVYLRLTESEAPVEVAVGEESREGVAP